MDYDLREGGGTHLECAPGELSSLQGISPDVQYVGLERRDFDYRTVLSGWSLAHCSQVFHLGTKTMSPRYIGTWSSLTKFVCSCEAEEALWQVVRCRLAG